jgi:hypothetical protein
MGLISQANVIARVGALAGFYGVELDPLNDALGSLAPRLARGALVTVPITFDRIAISTRVEREDLESILEADQLMRIDKLTAGTRPLELELEAGPRTARTLRVDGSRDLTVDLGRLAGYGVAASTLDTVRECGADLGVPDAISDRAEGGAHAWRFHFGHRNDGDSDRAKTRQRVLAVARKLGATPPQCNLVEGLHDMLAKDRDSYTALMVARDAVRLAVRWQRVRWETAIRMAIGFQPQVDAGAKLGELSGAFDAEQVHALELVLGPEEPPVMRVAVAYVA